MKNILFLTPRRSLASLARAYQLPICSVGTYQKAGYATPHPYRSDYFLLLLACQLSAGK